jgi:Leucine-rich repeat (LRR) protein
MAVGELFLSAFLQVLFNRLGSRELLNFVRRDGLRKKLERWSETLKGIEAVLADADEKQHAEVAVKNWLDDLRDLAYDLEDILDEFFTETMRCKASYSGFTPRAVKVNMRLESNIKEITGRFNRMVKQKDDLKLSSVNVDRRSYRMRETLAPTSVVTEAHVYGRDSDKEALLEFLVGDKRSDAQLSVIPIVAMGGMGKTTLAQLVYNDKKVQSFFDLRAWACVSQDFDAVRVTKAILKSVSASGGDDNDLNLLQVKLKQKLEGKKFLVILDDLWNESYHDWTILRAPFEAGAPGSMIIITTRNQGVSSKTSTISAYSLKELSNDFCLSILAHHALGTRDFSTHLNLKDIGEAIVGRCKGSPLAAKVIGGILRNKLDRDEWEKVLKSKIWGLPEVESEIAPALMLSYYHLPSNLKRCFAYCSILPKDYEFTEKELVLLWMAEGLIQPLEEGKQMEDLGIEYFRNLLLRSFFQQSFKDESRFLMHDLINDLAQWVAGDICFKMENRSGGNTGRQHSKKARHSSYLGDYCDGIQKFEVFYDLTYLRTFMSFILLAQGSCYLTSDVPLKLLPKLRRLRVLSLSGYNMSELSESIGDLKHLRFLDLSHMHEIRSLPESVATLYNLQTLILENCHNLRKLPSKIGNLVNLRHLNIIGAYKLEGMPPQIGKLTCLRSLSNLVVGKASCSEVKELGPLLHLCGTLCISNLGNVINPKDARDARLIEKTNLYGLSLEWRQQNLKFDESQDRTSEFKVLSMLQPHKGLKELTIKGYGGAEFPSWLSGHFSNMVLLKIEYCKKCTSLPAMGQLPSLKDLSIYGMTSVKIIGREFYGEGCSQPFRSLESLHFRDMQELENWIPCGEFPKLRKLFIRRCPKLVGKLPNHLPLLENIVIYGCKQLAVSISTFPELCKLEIEGSRGVMHKGKVEFSLLSFSSLSTISEFTCQIEGFNMEGLTYLEDSTTKTHDEPFHFSSREVRLEHLPSLGVMRIHNCTKLVSLTAKEEEDQLQLDLPFKLRDFKIKDCEDLKSLPKEMMYNKPYLEKINIHGCTSLTNFAVGQLPPTLKQLHITRCTNMVILVDGDDINSYGNNTSLIEELDISDCPSLKSLTSSGELPATLKFIYVWNCEKLESIAKSFHLNSSLEFIHIDSCANLKSLPKGIHSLNHLDRIYISECPILDSFPDGGLLPTSLRSLSIFNCEKIQVLPNCTHNLTSLQKLEIWECPSIVSFPEVDFLTNLTSLSIHDMASFNEAFFEWGLCKLTSLKRLKIGGGSSHLVSFPEMKLPASLIRLEIACFPNLKYLSSKGFQDIDSLEELDIRNCKKLKSFPKDGLPPSLLRLFIDQCPLLKEQCKKDKGREWLKIAHIPIMRFQ